MEVTLFNCKGNKTIHVKDGEVVPGEGGDYVDCKGLPVKTLRCTIALNYFKSWEELLSDPVPPPERVDSFLSLGVGLVIAPKGTKSALVKVVEREFVLDPYAPPEEVPERGAVVARSIDADSSYGYKRERGKWPVEDLGEKAKNNIILNPFWVTTWEAKLIKLPAFMPEMANLGTSSPVPPELLKAIYVPLSGVWGPDSLEFVETLLARSHYWSPRLRAEHADEECWRFVGLQRPSLEGGKAYLWVGLSEPELVILEDKILTREELLELRSLASPLL